MRWLYCCIATTLVLASSTALGQGEGPSLKLEDERLVRTSNLALDGSCWDALDGKSKRYALKNAKEDCIKDLNLEVVEPVEVDGKDGEFKIRGKVAVVKATLGPVGLIGSVTEIGEGPFVLVLGDNKVVRADRITLTNVTPQEPKASGKKFDRCDWREHHNGDVRIDLPRGSVEHAPPRNIVQPNRGLVVHVCRDREQNVWAVWAGARGLTRSGLAPDGESQSDGKAAGDSASKPVEISTMRFPPRKPGTADLKIYEGTDTMKQPLLLVELEVEPLYWGAVRFGLGTLFGNWRGYEIATVSGSRTQEVRQVRNATTFELVSGFAPYVFDLHTGGRSQSGGANNHFAPFIGFGVLGASPDQGVQGLSSFHLGIEIEVASNFSIAATFAYRRTRKLAAGYDVGSPVEMGMTADNITTDHWEPGFGLVINASPSFLQFATGKSSTTTDGGSK